MKSSCFRVSGLQERTTLAAAQGRWSTTGNSIESLIQDNDKMARLRGGGGGSACAARRKASWAAASMSRASPSSSTRSMTPLTVPAVMKTSSQSVEAEVGNTAAGANSHLGILGFFNHPSASPIDDSMRTTTTSPLRSLMVFTSRGIWDASASAAS